MQRIDALLGQVMGQLRQNVAGNPMASGMLNVIESGDAKKGEQMADNICQSMGVTREQALNQARQFFGI